MTKIKLILFSCAISFILVLCPGFVRAYSIVQDFWISYASYFCVVLFLCHKYQHHKKAITLSFISTIIVLYGSLFIINGLPFTLPNILGTILSCIAAYLFSVSRNLVYKYIIVGSSCFICIYFVFWGVDHYNDFYDYGSFTGKTDESVAPTWSSYIEPNIVFSADSANGKVILLDFYNTWCSVCFRKFPKLEVLYNKHKNDPSVCIYAVDIPWRDDTVGQALQMVRSRNYTFPVLIGKENLDSVFHVTCYPTVILLKNNHIFYKGDIENVEKFLESR